MVRIEINEAHISILPYDFQLVRERSIDVLGAEILNGASVRFPVDQWSIDLGVFDKRFNIVGRHSLWIFASEERRNLPTFFIIVRLNLCHALE